MPTCRGVETTRYIPCTEHLCCICSKYTGSGGPTIIYFHSILPIVQFHLKAESLGMYWLFLVGADIPKGSEA